jgi:putative ABC transport system ATP-binding protein
MPPADDLLTAQDLGRHHPDGTHWLVEGVSLELRPGERLAVTGPSGSGKTLLLRALALLDPIDQGRILWKGAAVHREQVPRFRRQVMYVHQRPALPEETVAAVLRGPFALGVHRSRRFDEDRIRGWLTEVARDESFLTKLTRELSGGEMQIVALLRALQLNPTILLLDEPTAALDSSTAHSVETLLQQWSTESGDGRALIWVTHDAAQAQRVAEKTLHLEGGRVVASG